MTDSFNRILAASPGAIARVMDLGGTPARVWQPEELGAVYQHQMSAPISVDLAGLDPSCAEALRLLTGAQGLLLNSFRDLFLHPAPPLDLLGMIKDFAKLNRHRSESLIPGEVAGVLYFLSIAAALVRWNTRITTLSDQELNRGFAWAQNQPWIDIPARDLFRQAEQHLSKGGSGPA